MRLLRSFKVQAEKLAAKPGRTSALSPTTASTRRFARHRRGVHRPQGRAWPPGEAQEIRGFKDAPLGP